MTGTQRGFTLGGLLLVIVLLGAAVVLWWQYRASLPRTEAPRGESLFPLQFAAHDINNTLFSTADRQGRVVLVNFFATWCQICQKEMRPLEQMYRSLHSRGFDIVMVSNEAEGHVRTFAENYKAPFPLIANGQEIMDQVKTLAAFPTAVLLDKEGHARYLIVGADLPKIRDAVAELMAEPSPVENAPESKPEAPRQEPGVEGGPFTLGFSGRGVGGQSFSTVASRGRVILVNIFDTNCGPCQMETPDLIALYQEHKAAGLEVVMVSGESEGAVRTFAESRKIPFPVIAGGRSIIEQLRDVKPVVPISVLLDRQGRVRQVVEGAQVPVIRDAVTRLLAEPATPPAQEKARVSPAPVKP